MSVINSAIFTILERFPGSKDAIKHLFNTNNNFQTLCEDFRQCSEALKYWSQSTRTDAPERSREYEALRNELACEIDRFLNTADKQSLP